MPRHKKIPAGAPLSLSPQGQALVDELDQLAGEVLDEATDISDPLQIEPGSKKARNIHITANVFLWTAVGLCLLLTLTFGLNQAADGVGKLHFFVEPTAAMAPKIPQGSLLLTYRPAANKIEPGEIVTYWAVPNNPDSRITRIVEAHWKESGQDMYRTKRAASAKADSIEFNYTSILGVKLAVLPFAGYAISFVAGYAPGLTAIAAALCLAAVLLRKWLLQTGAIQLKKRKGTKKAKKA
ncbi:MAG: hypothetical protein LBB50_05560 [Oscillospiraceae bacterium]|nr:hypothetical protein [Oscillospiraceae bacterium]